MIVVRPPAGAPGRAPLVALFGQGLIGSAVVAACRRALGAAPAVALFAWEDPEAQAEHARDLELRLRAHLAEDPRPLAVVWSAGRAGFGADAGAVASELASFRRVLALVERLAGARDARGCAFHLVSSAGGLFEGQRAVDRGASPDPRRPYGQLKVGQEALLGASAAPMGRHVYRPSSVYGPIRPGRRMGLLPVLVLNGLRRRVTPIVGHLSTLRDYVAAEDVGAFIGRRVLAPVDPGARTLDMLVAARPTTIQQVQRAVERVVGHRVYVALRHAPSNAGDITFAPDVLPAGWRPEDLETGVRRVHAQWLREGARTAV